MCLFPGEELNQDRVCLDGRPAMWAVPALEGPGQCDERCRNRGADDGYESDLHDSPPLKLCRIYRATPIACFTVPGIPVRYPATGPTEARSNSQEARVRRRRVRRLEPPFVQFYGDEAEELARDAGFGCRVRPVRGKHVCHVRLKTGPDLNESITF